MPMDKSRYPLDWDEISLHIRAVRAEWHCEFCGAEQGKRNSDTGSKVVLTVAHLGIDKPDGTPGDKSDTMDCRAENLAALCQRCHLEYDRDDHIRNRKINQVKRQLAYGQSYFINPLKEEDR